MRDLIADHVRARVERLADDLTDAIWLQMQRTIDDALDIARSALLSELAPFTTVEAPPAPSAAPTTKRAPAASPKPATSSPPLVRPLRSTEPASSPRCSKCGEPGHNARSCGRAPKGNPHGPRSAAVTASSSSATPAATGRNRFALIEEAARRRTTKVPLPAPAASKPVAAHRFIPRARPEPEIDEDHDEKPAPLPPRIEGVLPVPIYSCEFDTSRGRDPFRNEER